MKDLCPSQTFEYTKRGIYGEKVCIMEHGITICSSSIFISTDLSVGKMRCLVKHLRRQRYTFVVPTRCNCMEVSFVHRRIYIRCFLVSCGSNLSDAWFSVLCTRILLKLHLRTNRVLRLPISPILASAYWQTRHILNSSVW